ncbi:hypothetical protein PIB30_030453 [Stylosanthes scabra]|uniref:Uncharacterized protein n=1 Tax=Stylosanthes scabra TaxID=79078 RepID=A0ABU6SBM3_9FABA|nr:hypothetical protein [Stylosanthes scabra]
MASRTVSNVEANINADQPDAKTPLPNVSMTPSSSMDAADGSQSPTKSSCHKDGKKKKKHSEEKEKMPITPSPPEFLVANGIPPLTGDGYLKAPEPSVESSEIWRRQAPMTSPTAIPY